MSPTAQEQSLVADYSIIPDPHERMSAIVASCAGSGIPVVARFEEDLVPGCVSRVWLTAALQDRSLKLFHDADSPLVKGLAGLICRVYEGTAPTEAAAHETNILAALQLDRQLSPTRLHGLEQVARKILALAAALAAA